MYDGVPDAAESYVCRFVDVHQTIEVSEHGAGLLNCRHYCRVVVSLCVNLKFIYICGTKHPVIDNLTKSADSCCFLFWKLSASGWKSQIKMSDPKLDAVPNVKIDEGLFKYILIKVSDSRTGLDAQWGIEGRVVRCPCQILVSRYGICQFVRQLAKSL